MRKTMGWRTKTFPQWTWRPENYATQKRSARCAISNLPRQEPEAKTNWECASGANSTLDAIKATAYVLDAKTRMGERGCAPSAK